MYDDLDPLVRADIERARRLDRHATLADPTPNVGRILARRAAQQPEHPYLSYYDDELSAVRRYTYGEFFDRCRRVATYLQALGLAAGDRIATLAHNHDDSVTLYFSSWLIGIVVVPLNVGENDARNTFILQDAGVKILFALPLYAARAVALRDAVPGINAVVAIGNLELDFDPRGINGVRWQGLPTLGSALDSDALVVDGNCGLDAGEPALIVYTSGTTGQPKGVVLSHGNLIADIQGISSWHQIEADTSMMCVLPIHHVNGTVVTLLTPCYAGASTVLNRKFKTGVFWERAAREGVGIVSVVPTLLKYLLNEAEDLSAYDLPRLRHLICGAGPLTVELAEEFESFFGVRIVHGYGLSETTCYSCFLPLDLDDGEHRRWMRDYGFPSIGVPLPQNEMSIHNVQGQPAADGERGEIVIRGTNVMLRYLGRPEANAETFRDGWFHSGDEGMLLRDNQGRPYFFITGRIKELIIRGGVNVSPLEIDEVLNRHPQVAVGLAFGLPDEDYGEEIFAAVQLRDGAQLDDIALLEYCREHLPAWKCPKGIVRVEEIAYTSTGKPRRIELTERFSGQDLKHQGPEG